MENYVVEFDEILGDLRIVGILTHLGHRCGYIRVPSEHPLFGKKYDDCIEGLTKDDLSDMPVGDCGAVSLVTALLNKDKVCIEDYFDVHGSITYSSDSSIYPVVTDEPSWWFGFDCAPCYDTPDTWTADKVKSETIRFAKQLANFKDKGDKV